MDRNTTLIDSLCRLIGRSIVLPRKLRAIIIRGLIGFPPGVRPRQFLVRFHGHFYRGSTDSHIDWFVYYFGGYDEKGVNFLTALASKLDRPKFLDIGSNTGTHALALAKTCDLIHCFEPYPPALQALTRHVKENKLENIIIHPVGLSDRNHIADFYENKLGNLGAGTFVANENRKSDYQLKLANGDEYLDANGINMDDIELIKVDVEGLEINVIKGLAKCLSRSLPTVFWEFNSNNSVEHGEAILEAFPEGYKHFFLTFRNRWTRTQPRLMKIDQLEFGNIVSVHKRKLCLVSQFLVFNDHLKTN